jgi:hypothetical protein
MRGLRSLLIHLRRVLSVVNYLLNCGFFNIFIKVIVFFVLLSYILIKVVILIEVVLIIFISSWRLRLLMRAIINPERRFNAHDLRVFFVDLLTNRLFGVCLLDLLFI